MTKWLFQLRCMHIRSKNERTNERGSEQAIEGDRTHGRVVDHLASSVHRYAGFSVFGFHASSLNCRPCLFPRLLPNRPGQRKACTDGDSCHLTERRTKTLRHYNFFSLKKRRKTTQKAMNAITLRLQFGRECRLTTIESEDQFTFQSLQRLTERAFPTCRHSFASFIYVDDDGDQVTISSEMEMQPLRAFFARLCDQQTSSSSKPILQLQPIVNRNHANLTIDPIVAAPDDLRRSSRQKKFASLEANAEHILSSGHMLSLDMLEIIGAGNSGIVRRCRNRRTQELLAVKIISLDFQKDEKKHEIVTELNALNSLNSDYIVHLHGAYLHENAVHICTEYMDRGSLEQYIGLLIPENVLIYVALSMIHGLIFMWSQKIMHRDVKPSNVLVNSAGSVKLCDFGVSRVLETIGQNLPVSSALINTWRPNEWPPKSTAFPRKSGVSEWPSWK